MKQFVVDFEGEEEVEPYQPASYPNYIVFWWDSKRNVIEDCKTLHSQGIPVQLVKYIFKDLDTPDSDGTGWGVGVDDGNISDYDYAHNNTSSGRKYYHLKIDHRDGARDDGFIYTRSCWIYKEIAPLLSFFEAIPYNTEMSI